MAKRIQFSATGGPEVLQYVDFTPLDPAAGEVQIENKAIGINYIDTYVRSGLYAPASLPSGLGTGRPAWWSRSAPGSARSNRATGWCMRSRRSVPTAKSTMCPKKSGAAAAQPQL